MSESAIRTTTRFDELSAGRTIRLRRNADATSASMARNAFRNGNGTLRAQWCASGPACVYFGAGSLPDPFVRVLRRITAPVYVVYSYDTPIAWAVDGQELLTVPDVAYSQTTSQHQRHCVSGLVRDHVRGAQNRGHVYKVVGKVTPLRDGSGNVVARNAFRTPQRSPFGPRNGW